MRKTKRVLSVLLMGAFMLAPFTPTFAAFNGILPVPSVSTPSNPVTIALTDSDLGFGETATTTFTFAVAPTSFTTGNITSPNGAISNLAVTADPKVYTATFTPTTSTNDGTNVITVDFADMTTYTGTGLSPYAIAFDGTNMWTANIDNDSVTKISPTGTMTTYPIGVGTAPAGIAFDGTNMWAVISSNRVERISPTGVTTTFSGTGSSPNGIAFDGTNMWTANNGNASVTKVTPAGTMTTYGGTGATPVAIAFDGTNMWTVNSGGNSVTRISPSGATTTFTGLSGSPNAIAFDGTSMWVTSGLNDSITKISSTGTLVTYGAGDGAFGTVFDGVNMWTSNSNNNSVTKITPSGTTTTYPGTGATPFGIAFDGRNMWTVNIDDSSVTKVSYTNGTSSNYIVNTVPVAPTVVANAASGIGQQSATLNGTVSSTGGPAVTTRGFGYGTSINYGTTTTESGSFSAGSFSVGLSSLACGTLYHYRAYATNSVGTSFSSDATFTTSACSTGSSGSGGGGLGSPGSPALPPLTTQYQSYLTNLQNIGISVHGLVKLPDDGNPNTQEDTTVYYIGADGMRHFFPNQKVYFTWYSDFSGVQLIGSSQLASIPLGKNVTYKPGVKMVKFTTDPKVYAVEKNGVLRWITTEAAAAALYGASWNTLIDDISDAFYANYQFGTSISSSSDYSPAAAQASVQFPSDSLQM